MPATISALPPTEGNILIWIQNTLRSDALTPLMKFFSTLGNAGMLWIVLTLILMAVKKTRRIGFYSGISILVTFIIVNGLVKPFAGRIRPYITFEGLLTPLTTESDKCFPSGHAANCFACAWVLLRRMKKRIGIPALIMALLISYSRLYLGVHYPTDVLCGALIGVVVAELTIHIAPPYVKKLLAKINKKSKKRKKAKAKAKK